MTHFGAVPGSLAPGQLGVFVVDGWWGGKRYGRLLGGTYANLCNMTIVAMPAIVLRHSPA
jgi:hypothetical protein